MLVWKRESSLLSLWVAVAILGPIGLLVDWPIVEIFRNFGMVTLATIIVKEVVQRRPTSQGEFRIKIWSLILCALLAAVVAIFMSIVVNGQLDAWRWARSTMSILFMSMHVVAEYSATGFVSEKPKAKDKPKQQGRRFLRLNGKEYEVVEDDKPQPRQRRK